MTFGKWLKNTRLDYDMSLRQFSQLVGLSTVTLCKLENDRYEPGRNALRKIGEGLRKSYTEMREIVRNCELVEYGQ